MAELTLSKSSWRNWLIALSALLKIFKDQVDSKKREFNCTCVPVVDVIARHSNQYKDTCKVKDQLPIDK